MTDPYLYALGFVLLFVVLLSYVVFGALTEGVRLIYQRIHDYEKKQRAEELERRRQNLHHR